MEYIVRIYNEKNLQVFEKRENQRSGKKSGRKYVRCRAAGAEAARWVDFTSHSQWPDCNNYYRRYYHGNCVVSSRKTLTPRPMDSERKKKHVIIQRNIVIYYKNDSNGAASGRNVSVFIWSACSPYLFVYIYQLQWLAVFNEFCLWPHGKKYTVTRTRLKVTQFRARRADGPVTRGVWQFCSHYRFI